MKAHPKRIRLSRTKGSRLPAGAVNCTRPGKQGNPFREKDLTWLAVGLGFTGDLAGRTACAVELFRRWRGLDPRDGPLIGSGMGGVAVNVHVMLHGDTIEVPTPPAIDDLRGKDLACWCGLCPAHADGKPFGTECEDCSPCHADVLGELANQVPA
jgi:hypothetical protein